MGKSILIKNLIGLMQPQSGEIFIDEISMQTGSAKDISRIKRKFSLLFQNSALIDSLNVFYNVSLPLKEFTKLSKNEIKEKTLSTLSAVGLKNIENKMPAELSGGMQKRVALARAIVLPPKYLIYDEPTTGLDPIIANEIINLIAKTHNEMQLTSIIITHDLNFIDKLESKVFMLKNKSVCFEGSSTDFLSSNNEEVKSFRKAEK